jgi:hypothetical protein
MTTASLRSSDWRLVGELTSAPRLRLTAKSHRPHGTAERRREPEAAELAGQRSDAAPPAASGSAPVLVAGSDPVRRATVRDELADLMPDGTRFEELGTFSELLGCAPSSRMVVLSGELDQTPAEVLLRALGHRHPDLPVVSFEPPALTGD